MNTSTNGIFEMRIMLCKPTPVSLKNTIYRMRRNFSESKILRFNPEKLVSNLSEMEI